MLRLNEHGHLITSLFEHAKVDNACNIIAMIPNYIATESFMNRLNRDGFQKCQANTTLPDGSPVPDSHCICQQVQK